jgi:hypothetical protein
MVMKVKLRDAVEVGLAATVADNSLLATGTVDRVSATGGGTVAMAFDDDTAGNQLQQQNADGSTT